MQRTQVERPVRPMPELRVVAERDRPGRLEEAVVRERIRDGIGLEGGFTAGIAPSCLVRPEPGDRVLVWRRGREERIAVAVLERKVAAAAVLESPTGLVLEAPRVSVRAERLHLRAGELLTSARAVHEVSGVTTRSAAVRVADIGTDVRRAKNARDEVEGAFVQRLGVWVSDTAREARIAARAMLFS